MFRDAKNATGLSVKRIICSTPEPLAERAEGEANATQHSEVYRQTVNKFYYYKTKFTIKFFVYN